MKDFLSFIQSQKKKSKKILEKHKDFILPISLLLATSLLFITDTWVHNRLKDYTLTKVPFEVSSAAKYPVISRDFLPEVSAQAAVVMDNDSKVVLYEKNPEIRFSPASTTKIMTALVGLDYYNLGDTLTVMMPFTEGSVLGLTQGERITFENLLYAMLLPSANDSAHVIAQNYPGGEEAFIAKMNKKAQSLSLNNTHFGDPAGLQDDANFTTAKDLARLASVAIKNKTFAKIVDTKTKVITSVDRSFVYNINNLNKLLGLYGVSGIKTGYTEEAGEVLVTSTIIKGHSVIIVVMRSENRFADTEKLLQLISENVNYLSIHP